MHECPNCYRTCDCDGETTWFRVEALVDACIHQCNGGFMSLKKLNAENAIIKTAAVEVKTLTISGKQVTLAVFRQLQESPLIVFNRNLSPVMLPGFPWGKVNYHPDKCDSPREPHMHIVWQSGDTLYRSRIDELYIEAVRRSWPDDYVMRRDARGDAMSLHFYTHYGTSRVGQEVKLDGDMAEEYYALIEPLTQLDQLFIAV